MCTGKAEKNLMLNRAQNFTRVNHSKKARTLQIAIARIYVEPTTTSPSDANCFSKTSDILDLCLELMPNNQVGKGTLKIQLKYLQENQVIAL